LVTSKKALKKEDYDKKINSLQILKKSFKLKTIDVEMFSTIASFLSFIFFRGVGVEKQLG